MCGDTANAMQILNVIGTAASAIGSVQRGREQAAAYDYSARQAEIDAQAAREGAVVTAAKVRKAGQRQRSEAIASLAASGVDVGSGSALKIDQAIARNAEEDAQMELLSGNLKGDRLQADAQNMRVASKNATRAGYLGAGTSLLAGADKMVKPGWVKSKSAEQ